MVRLKVVCQYADEGYVTFQFHYGTIKSGCVAPKKRTFTQFQFHYGTIKRNGDVGREIVSM